MRLHDRYLVRELLTPLTFCLVGIQSFVMVSSVFADAQKIQDSKLHFLDTVEYACASSLESLPIILPVSLLLALLMSLSNHARYNEITALRAAGISLWRICLPYFIVGHVGDGNFHMGYLIDPTIPAERETAERLSAQMVARAIALEGTCSGEHGIGLHKQGFLLQEAGEGAIDQMRALKRALDPNNIMNPGKIFV